VPLSVDECRAKAAECDRIAAQTPDPAVKAAYQQMAQAWREVADQGEWLMEHRPSPRPKR
jgi:hypothetical protein